MRLLCMLMLAFVCKAALAQTEDHPENSLLYQVTGNGLSRPSYVYGTMHVSNKVAFHLSDTFFNALKSADVVGLETDPSLWFGQMLHSQYYDPANLFDNMERKLTSLNEQSFRLKPDNNSLSRAMSFEPDIVNGFLYRHRARSDFEENTYLDMYIYQAARKLGKPVHSVEDFEESERLVTLAREAVNKGQRAYNRHRRALAGEHTMESAYRNGNLKMLDSLDRLMGYPEAYYENMLYKRNYNMAVYMDNLMCRKSMFVGVGASHLPGKKGLLNMLREMGYTVKAVPRQHGNSRMKEEIDRMTVPLEHRTFTSEDQVFSMSVPGEVYTYPKEDRLQKYLCQDMANGSYYLVTRVRTYASLHGQSAAHTLARIDSLLYENIPGKIEWKKATSINGFSGFGLLNRNGRGNYQRHLIAVLPDEVIFFRMHGPEDYVKRTGEAFFASLSVHPLPLSPYTVPAAQHGFTLAFPVTPLACTDRSPLHDLSPARNEWLASLQGTVYYAQQAFLNNTEYIEEDSFELELMAHYFAGQLGARVSGKTFGTGPVPAMTCTMHSATDTAHARVLIDCSRLYVLYTNARSTQEREAFFGSFAPAEADYGEPFVYTDTVFNYRVCTHKLPDRVPAVNSRYDRNDSFDAYAASRTFTDKRTGTQVRLSYYRYNKYENEKDSATYWKWRLKYLNQQGDYVLKILGRSASAAAHTMDLVLQDTGSSRGIRYKIFLTRGTVYTLAVPAGREGNCTAFAREIFETFEPGGIPGRRGIFDDKSDLLLADLASSDSATQVQAMASVRKPVFHPDSAATIIRAIEILPAHEERAKIRSQLIRELGTVKTGAVLPWLRQAYLGAGDTLETQLSVLFALTMANTRPAYKLWRNLMQQEAPDAEDDGDASDALGQLGWHDTLDHMRIVIPTLLDLLQKDEYKEEVYSILSGLREDDQLKPSAYRKAIGLMTEDARKALKRDRNSYDSWDLAEINSLLIPFYSQRAVKKHFAKALQTRDTGKKIETVCLMLQHGAPVHDTILYNLAVKPRSRQQLYEALEDEGLERFFPAAFTSLEARVEGMIYATITDQLTDTVVIIGETQVMSKGKAHTVYAYKFRRSSDPVWQTGITGLCNTDSCPGKPVKELSAVSSKYYVSTLNPAEFITDEVRSIRAARKTRQYYNPYDLDY